MEKIRVEEVSRIISDRIKNVDQATKLEETGTALTVLERIKSSKERLESALVQLDLAIDKVLDSRDSQAAKDQAALEDLKSEFDRKNKALENLAKELGREVEDVLTSVKSVLTK